MLYKACGVIVFFLFILESCDSINITDTIWRVITTTTQDPTIKANVQTILSLKPSLMQVMAQNNEFDLDCVLYLNENGIRVSQSYHEHSVNIHADKLGHWCTFLRFLDLVDESGKTGVWIEEDVLLELKDIDNIMQAINKDHPKAVVRMCKGDGVLLVRNASEMLKMIKNLEITDPVDAFYSAHEMVETGCETSFIKKMNPVKGGITIKIHYPINLVNKMIQMRVGFDMS
jgi:hypothetical protein